FFQAEDGIRDFHVTGVQTCALPICPCPRSPPHAFDLHEQDRQGMGMLLQTGLERARGLACNALGGLPRDAQDVVPEPLSGMRPGLESCSSIAWTLRACPEMSVRSASSTLAISVLESMDLRSSALAPASSFVVCMLIPGIAGEATGHVRASASPWCRPACSLAC